MIARLKGVLVEAGADQLVLDVGGVGYLALASARTLGALPPAGGDVVLLTEMQVREDAITLFGFGSAAERDWFRLLTSVQGVGGRVALAILSVLAPDELSRAIAAADKASVARATGVGPKLALRIVTELKDKGGIGSALAPAGGAKPADGGHAADAISALLNLGFRPLDASAAVDAAGAELGPGATLDAIVRLALRKSARP
ncbi:Holliday junction DNA helicase RuvA [Sphingomonas jejuensis]|uniref:Holliday junction branch migration complex subunit RuvA n=1 Tax=Sphingomonas jejuensis TaxID=904715 RepID=A0ABX0XMB2_9SPHN|nr:Holliday junction branch migration protein RuvA [Sphingomonas jejuensis]NJC34518.1 Holliday junction DNA helicase RuvA [Sphingomonas jejuensis]